MEHNSFFPKLLFKLHLRKHTVEHPSVNIFLFLISFLTFYSHLLIFWSVTDLTWMMYDIAPYAPDLFQVELFLFSYFYTRDSGLISKSACKNSRSISDPAHSHWFYRSSLLWIDHSGSPRWIPYSTTYQYYFTSNLENEIQQFHEIIYRKSKIP